MNGIMSPVLLQNIIGGINGLGIIKTSIQPWMSYTNQIGRSFTAIRDLESNGTSKEYLSLAIFRSPDEVYLTNADAPFVIYYILDDSSIEAIINKKDRPSSLTSDMLTRKDE